MDEKELRAILASTLNLLRETYSDYRRIRIIAEATQKTLESNPGFLIQYNEQVILAAGRIDGSRGEVLRWLDQAIRKLKG